MGGNLGKGQRQGFTLSSSRCSSRRSRPRLRSGSIPYLVRVEQPAPLTEQEKVHLRRTWRLLESDPTAVGVIMFTRLFEEHPELQQHFSEFREMDLEHLKSSQQLQQHASRVMGFVNKLIGRLDTEEKFIAITRELCRRHLNYGAAPDHMHILGDQFIAVLRSSLEKETTGDHWNPDTQAAWQNLFQWVAWIYEETYLENFSARSAALSQRARSAPQRSTVTSSPGSTRTIGRIK